MHGFSTRVIDSEDSMCLLNLSNLFYDNLYLEEKNQGQPPFKQAYFLLAFRHFVDRLEFVENEAGNLRISEPRALKVVKLLFEGQTRKIGAINFLRLVFTKNFA